MKKPSKRAKKNEPKTNEDLTSERLTKDDLKALRTNVKAGRNIPPRCCEMTI